jgi:hypothetical protein
MTVVPEALSWFHSGLGLYFESEARPPATRLGGPGKGQVFDQRLQLSLSEPPSSSANGQHGRNGRPP